MPHAHALITGGAGFIGSHLSEFLLAQGVRVTVLDDLSTGSIDNIRHLESRDGFRILVGSAADASLLERIATDVDVLYHLAAVVGVRKVMHDTVATIETNLHSTEAVLSVANRFRIRTVLTSTSEVYGASTRDKLSEEDDEIIGPSHYRRWCYAAGKLLDEFHAYAYFHSMRLPVTIARLFNTIGPRQVGHYGMVVPTFVRQALRGEPITVHGDGEQTRCFTWVGDVVRALAALADRPETVGEVYNIGSEEEVTILRLAEMVKELTGSPSEIVIRNYSEVYGEDFVDMRRRHPNTDKLRAAVGFAPDTPLPTSLKAVIDAMRSVE